MTFLILGGGWIGESFAQQMLAEGHRVFASTTQDEKYARFSAERIFAIKADFDKVVPVLDFPKEVDYVVNSVPAIKRLSRETIIRRFDVINQLLSGIHFKKHIFLSSVGIYPDQNGLFTEDFPIDCHQNLFLAEERMLQLPNTHVFRLGGLFGRNRIFAKYFQNKVCTTGAQLTNFIHLDDVSALLKRGVLEELKNNIYNLVSPEHPTKKEVILASAEKYGFALPSSFENQDNFQKIVDGERIRQELGYTFLFPSPLDF